MLYDKFYKSENEFVMDSYNIYQFCSNMFYKNSDELYKLYNKAIMSDNENLSSVIEGLKTFVAENQLVLNLINTYTGTTNVNGFEEKFPSLSTVNSLYKQAKQYCYDEKINRAKAIKSIIKEINKYYRYLNVSNKSTLMRLINSTEQDIVNNTQKYQTDVLNLCQNNTTELQSLSGKCKVVFNMLSDLYDYNGSENEYIQDKVKSLFIEEYEILDVINVYYKKLKDLLNA